MFGTKTKRILVVGGSRGFGAATVKACLENGDSVIALATSQNSFEVLHDRPGLVKRVGDARDRQLAIQVLQEEAPDVVVLNAGVIGAVKPITEQSWDEFSATWNLDVRATLIWCQEAIRLPLTPGSRILVMSSGAAHGGSPLTGGYPGAKRTQWIMANFFRGECTQAGIDIKFTTVLPQLAGDTDLSRPAAEAYGKKAGISGAEFVSNMGKPFNSKKLGESMCALIHERKYRDAITVSINGEGIKRIED